MTTGDTSPDPDPDAGALALDANLVLAAGAGAGKTHALVSVALGLYVGAGRHEPSEPTGVWAVTFTEKAARELRQRIVQRASALAGDPVAGLVAEPELAAMLGSRVVAGPRWRAIVDQLPAAPIGTFHSLCGQLLRSYAVEAGVDPNFRVLDENDASELFDRILDEVLVRELEQDPVDSHTRAAARALGGPDVLRAALRRLHTKLGEEGRDPDSLLVDPDQRGPQPGFDRVAAQAELDQACVDLAASLELLASCEEDRLGPTVRVLAHERNRIGGCEPEQVQRWYPAVVRVASQRRGKGKLPKRANRVWEPFATAWDQVQDAVASLAEQQLAGRIVALLGLLAHAYAAEKQRLGVLDFVDLVRGAHDLLRDDRAVRAQVKQRISALLVDEFQDTNALQLDLIHLLAEARDHERELGPGERASVVIPLGPRCFAAVGDRKQSIYEFRGADVSLFQSLAARARAGGIAGEESGLRLHALRRSWRSRPGLVEFCNRLFARLLVSDDPEGFAVDWVDDVDRLEPVREDHETQRGLPAVQLLVAEPSDDARLRRADETRRLAEHVALLLEARPPLGPAGRDGRPRALRGADVAILMRTHTHVARYRKALSERGIASIVVGGRGFYAAREVRELAVLLLAIADPSDTLASAGVWRSPIWGISDGAIVKLAAAERLELAAHANGCRVGLRARDAAVVTHMARLVHGLHHELDRLGPARVLRFAIEHLAVREVLAWDPASEQRIANVDKLVGLLDSRAFAGLGAASTARRLLARSEDVLDREAPAEVAAAADPNAVRIMTIHAAKGLEFPVVIVPELGAEPRGQAGPVLFERELGLAVVSPDLVGRRRPSVHATAVAERLAARRDAESRRLLYVATTRARDLLVLLGDTTGGRAESSGNWRRLIDEVLPDLGELVEIVEAGAGVNEPEPELEPATAMAWLLDRVAAVRSRATESAGPEPLAPGADPEPQATSFEVGAAATPEPAQTRGPGPMPRIDPVALALALERSESIELRGCELEVSLTGFAEFDNCARRYLLSHVVGLDSPPSSEPPEPPEPPEPAAGLWLVENAGPVPVDDERDDPRARGRLIHELLARVDLDRLGDDPRGALEALAGFAHASESVCEDLLRLATRPWIAALIEAHRADPRRVLRALPFALELQAEHEHEHEHENGLSEASLDGPRRPQLDLFAPPATTGAAAVAPDGRVIVRGRVDLVWIDDAGRLNLVDWQSSLGPSSRAAILDPDSVAGFRRLTQAWALRCLWGPEVPIRAGAVFLRGPEPDPQLDELEPSTLVGHEQRLRRTAARLLEVELGDPQRGSIEGWPKLDGPGSCGSCIHLQRCWTATPAATETEFELELELGLGPGPEFEAEFEFPADEDAQIDAEFAGEIAWSDEDVLEYGAEFDDDPAPYDS